jgi:FixJ family two-component response regulator
MRQRVVVLGGEQAWREATAADLQISGLRAEACRSVAQFFADTEAPGPLCVLADSTVPEVTELVLMAEMKDRKLTSALLFRVEPLDLDWAVTLMKAGATDVMSRSLNSLQLIQRILVVMRRESIDITIAARAKLKLLSHRELQVVTCATQGWSNKETADRLNISFRTVEVHRRNAMRKLGTYNITELTHVVVNARIESQPRTNPPASVVALSDAQDALSDLNAVVFPSDATLKTSSLGQL